MNGLSTKFRTVSTRLGRWTIAGMAALALAGATTAQVAGPGVPGVPGVPRRGDVSDFSKLPRLEPGQSAPASRNRPPPGHLQGARGTPPPVPRQPKPTARPVRRIFGDATTGQSPTGGVQFLPASTTPSPPPSASMQGILDDATQYNPDSQGALGTNHMMTMTSSEVQVLDRMGNQLSRVTLSNFWANIGTNGQPDVFEPRLLYEPYNKRWIATAVANPGTNNPGLLVAVSQSSDPTGTWNRYFIDVDLVSNIYALTPNLGFSRDSIVIQANMFSRTNNEHVSFDVWVFNKASLYAGAASPPFNRFSLPGGFDQTDFGPPANAMVPAAVYDNSVTTNYLVANWSGNDTDGGHLRVYYIATNSNSGLLVMTPGDLSVELPFDSPPWDIYSPNDDNFARQSGVTNKIYMGDARIQNCVYRSETLWVAQTIFLPAAGAATHCAVQWWEITPGGVADDGVTITGNSVVQRGRIEDTSGVKFYAYPSIAVNRRNDVVVGYSRFSANQFASADYAFRIDADPFSSLRADTVLKSGEAPFTVNDHGITHWGAWSATTVDPNSDTDLWTLQEFASSPVAGSDRWGTWWGRISPPADLSVSLTGTPNPLIAGSNITYAITVDTINNKIQTVTGVRLVDTLPAGAILVSAVPSQGACGLTNGIVTCDFGTVGDTGRVTATIIATLNNNGTVNNTVTVSSYGPELTPSDNTASVSTMVSSAADLAVFASDAPDPVTVSNTLTYSILVTNRGPSAALAVILTDTLPTNMTFLSHAPSQGSCSRNGNVVTCSLGTVATQAFATVQIQIAPTSPGNITNRVTVGSNAVDPVTTNNTNVIVSFANAAPTLGSISDRTINEDSSLSAVAFQVGDVETLPASLVVTGFCSNPSIVPGPNIVFGGSGSSRTITVTPAPNANGVVTITRIVFDALGASATNAFLLTILPVNDAPSISDIPDFAIDEDTTTNITVTVSDPETSAAALTVSAASSNPTLVPNASLALSGSGPTRTLSLTPTTNQFGATTITVTVSDGTNTTSDTFLLTVRPVNDPPTLSSIGPRTVNEDTSTGPLAFTVADLETSGSNLVVSAISSNTNLVPNANITFAITSAGTNRTVTVLPGTNQNGIVNITIRVADTDGAVVSNSFQLTINAINDPPTFNPISDLTTNEDSGPVTLALTGIGPGATNEVQDVVITATSGNTSLIPTVSVSYSHAPGDTTGSLSFTPVTNSSGVAIITVTAFDGLTNTVRTFNVTITAVNDTPVISDIANRSINEDTTTGPISFTVGDVESAATVLSLSGSSSDPNIVPNGNITFGGTGASRTVTVTPAPNATGTCTITVNVSDGLATGTDTFLLTVLPVNDAPTISSIPDQAINEDSPTNVSFIIGDLENPPGSLTVAVNSSNQGLVPNLNLPITGAAATRVLSITPAANQVGTTTITLTVTDLDGGTNATSFLLTVLPVNDPPTIATIPDVNVNEGDPQQQVVLTGISAGPANEPQTLTFTTVSGTPSLIPNPTVSYTNGNNTAVLRFTSAPHASGNVSITVTADDGATTNRTASRTFVIHVLPVNDLPTVSDIVPQSMLEDTTLIVNFTVFDYETAADNLTYTAFSTNPELIDDNHFVFGGTGTNRTLTVRPLTNAFGSASINIDITDADGGVTEAIVEINVLAVNDPPSVSGLFNRTINEDTTAGPIPFTVDDPDNNLNLVSVTVASSNPELVPAANLTLGGANRNRTLTAVPTANLSGTTTITVTVSDGTATATNAFVLTVLPVNDLPTISDIADRTINEEGSTGPISFTIGDVETAAGALTLLASSSDPILVPSGNITFGGSGANRTVTVTPAADRSGSATITVTVTDANAGSTSDTFLLVVNPVNDAPTLNAIPNQTTSEDAGPVTVQLAGISAGPNESQFITVVASSSNPGLVPTPVVVYQSPLTTGSVTLTPAANSNGTAIITVTVMDNAGGNNAFSQMFMVTVLPVNDPPTLDSIASLVIGEDSPQQTVNLTGIGAGPPNESQSLVVTATSSDINIIPDPAVIYSSPDPAGTLRFTPVPNAFGTVTLTVTVNDGGNINSNFSRTFTVTVTNVNDPPTISGLGSLTVGWNSSSNLSFTVGDIDNPAASLTLTSESFNTALIPVAGLVLGGSGANRTLTITPTPNQIGSATVSVTARDPAGAAVTNTFLVTVSELDNPPTISDIADRSAPEDAPITIPFTVGDSETAAANLVVTGTSSNPALIPPSAIVFGGSGASRTVTLTPLPNQTGPVLITVSVTDGSGGAASDSFTLTLTSLNDLPTLTGLPPLTINEDTATGPLSFTVGDVETAPGSLSVTASSSNAGLVPNANILHGGSGADRTITITPLPDQVGTTTITLIVIDGNGGTTNTSFLLTVAPVNDPPTLAAISDRTVAEDAPVQSVSLAGISAGPGENQSLNFSAASSNPSLIPTPSVSYINGNSTGVLSFTPAPNATGTALITVTVNDNAGSNNIALRTFTVTVTPANDLPTVSAIGAQATTEDTPLTVSFNVGDAETAALSLTVTATSTNATLLPASNILINGSGAARTATLIPSTNQSGTTLVTLTVNDGLASASSSFVLTVNAVDDPPTMNPLEDVSLAWNFANTTIPFNGVSAGAPNENQPLLVTATSANTAIIKAPTFSYVSPATNGSILLSHGNTAGAVLISLTISDGVTTRTQSFTAYVRPNGGTPPTLSALANQSINEDTSTAAIPFTISDAVTPAASLTVSGQSSNPTLVPKANIVFGGSGSSRTVTVTPAPNQFGSAQITVSVLNANSGRTATNFLLTVNPVNDAPTVSTIANQTISENGTLGPIAFGIGDVETPAGSLVLTASSSNAGLVPNANIILGGSGTNRALSITPVTNQNGSAVITLTVSDGTTIANTTFTLTVNAVNDPPTISDIPDQTTAEATPTAAIAFTIADPDTALASLALSAASSNPSLIPAGNITFGGSAGSRTVTLTPLSGQSGTSLITASVSDGTSTISDTFLLTVLVSNRPPTLNPIASLNLNQNASLQTVPLANITSGSANENQTLIVTASSSNPALIPHPAVIYTSPATTGSLTFTPAPNLSGTTTITVTVNDRQALNNIVTRTFTVTVNGPPVLSAMPNQIVREDGAAAIPFTVSDPETPATSLTVSAVSSNIGLVPNSAVTVVGTGANRTVNVTPLPNLSGNTFISLTASDPNGNSSVSTFLLTVVSVNDAPTLDPLLDLNIAVNAPAQTVNLAGITTGAATEIQTLTVTATSSIPSIIPNPGVSYVSPNTSGTLTFTPVPGASGVALITVQVQDNGGISNGGSNSVTRTFSVGVGSTVTPQLRIQLAGGRPLVSWPDTAGSRWLLQGAPGVAGAPVWRSVPVTPVQTAGRYWVTNAMGSTMKVFRLCDGCPPIYSPPDLNIRRLANNDLRLSWSAAFGDFVLESRADATSGTWTSIIVPPVVISGTNNVFLSISDATSYFRLRGP